uniref:Uncharacterized protein n=1 Tax=Chromera velia CCMP2878 TaxID=1169474 RepID=A0A0G4GW29_9ALVE|eukprot:Cvel_5301.t1-p1 / transcript=Cvel_5301.t1 / gene=Cvel_5301 / organism=Chromera_velia_CCMP2878 / gene_product=hypothetical protein / transcript_product=hypothetical protein / location=Cvel_scaffold245:65374-65826(-) / protein_length=151 / sequence_SO=supercontig / SO=protein_coding / is_pseudo=false
MRGRRGTKPPLNNRTVPLASVAEGTETCGREGGAGAATDGSGSAGAVPMVASTPFPSPSGSIVRTLSTDEPCRRRWGTLEQAMWPVCRRGNGHKLRGKSGWGVQLGRWRPRLHLHPSRSKQPPAKSSQGTKRLVRYWGGAIGCMPSYLLFP